MEQRFVNRAVARFQSLIYELEVASFENWLEVCQRLNHFLDTDQVFVRALEELPQGCFAAWKDNCIEIFGSSQRSGYADLPLDPEELLSVQLGLLHDVVAPEGLRLLDHYAPWLYGRRSRFDEQLAHFSESFVVPMARAILWRIEDNFPDAFEQPEPLPRTQVATHFYGPASGVQIAQDGGSFTGQNTAIGQLDASQHLTNLYEAAEQAGLADALQQSLATLEKVVSGQSVTEGEVRAAVAEVAQHGELRQAFISVACSVIANGACAWAPVFVEALGRLMG